MNTSFSQSLKIQYNAIKALILREIITRWGRRNIGFLWLFVEPIIVLLIFALILAIRGRFDNLRYDFFGISILAFILVGYAPFMLWRNAVSLSANAIRSNTALLHHRNLRPLDFYAARLTLEIVGVSASFMGLLFVLSIFSWIPYPKELSTLITAWALMIWFAIGFGLTMGTLLAQFELLNVVWRAIAIILMICSGVFFFVAWLPIEYQKVVLWIPMIHGSEMIKHGYFGNLINTYENPAYLILWNIILTFTGLNLAKGFGKHVPVRL